MNCPTCKTSLTSIKVGDLTVDACQNGCGGIWFDRFELGKVNEQNESAGESLLNIPRKQPSTSNGAEQPRLNCPKCGIVMMRHFSNVSRKVVIDECPKCAGTWLDAGELAAIRTMNESDAGKAKNANAYFNELFAKQLVAARNETAAHLEKSQKIAKMFRFICPSTYIPGKQDWGAF